jgi:hypothetical protein
MVLDFNPFVIKLKEAYGGEDGLNIDTHVVHANEEPALSVAQDLFNSEDIGESFSQIPYRVTISREPIEGSQIVPWEGGLVHWVSNTCRSHNYTYSHLCCHRGKRSKASKCGDFDCGLSLK